MSNVGSYKIPGDLILNTKSEVQNASISSVIPVHIFLLHFVRKGLEAEREIIATQLLRGGTGISGKD